MKTTENMSKDAKLIGDMILEAYTAGDLPRAVVIRSTYKQMLGLNPGDDESVMNPLDEHCNESICNIAHERGDGMKTLNVRFATIASIERLIKTEYDVASIASAMPDMIEELSKIKVK